MGIDSRDWYRDKIRQDEGYVERAAFRVSLGQVQRDTVMRQRRHAWARIVVVVLVVFAAPFVLKAAMRAHAG